MSSLRLKSSLDFSALQTFPKECMIETGWYCLSQAVRKCLTKRELAREWKSRKEDVVDGCLMGA